ncbi:MAG: hypothetical protein AAGK04_06955, partial [Planctomycetota bacterium]
MTTTDTHSKAQAATKHENISSDELAWDPVFDELGFPQDPDNLYTQTVATMLKAADIIDLRHRVKVILAQPKNEIMVHFPLKTRWCPSSIFTG